MRLIKVLWPLLWLTTSLSSAFAASSNIETTEEKPNFATSINSNKRALTAEFHRRKNEGLMAADPHQPHCPHTPLDPYAAGKAGTSDIMKECGNLVLVSPFGKPDANPSFIKFLVITKEHIPNAWSIPNTKLVPQMINCARDFISAKGSTEKLLSYVEKQCGDDYGCSAQFNEQKKLVPKAGFHASDFVPYFHVLPSLNHLHMHMALWAPKYRKYSTTRFDKRSMAAEDVQHELIKMERMAELHRPKSKEGTQYTKQSTLERLGSHLKGFAKRSHPGTTH